MLNIQEKKKIQDTRNFFFSNKCCSLGFQENKLKDRDSHQDGTYQILEYRHMEAKGRKIGGTVFTEDSVDPLKGSGAGTALAVGGQDFCY